MHTKHSLSYQTQARYGNDSIFITVHNLTHTHHSQNPFQNIKLCFTSNLQSAFHSGKALFQVGNDVINMLGADREADGVGLDALVEQLLSRKLAVGGGGRADNRSGRQIAAPPEVCSGGYGPGVALAESALCA